MTKYITVKLTRDEAQKLFDLLVREINEAVDNISPAYPYIKRTNTIIARKLDQAIDKAAGLLRD